MSMKEKRTVAPSAPARTSCRRASWMSVSVYVECCFLEVAPPHQTMADHSPAMGTKHRMKARRGGRRRAQEACSLLTFMMEGMFSRTENGIGSLEKAEQKAASSRLFGGSRRQRTEEAEQRSPIRRRDRDMERKSSKPACKPTRTMPRGAGAYHVIISSCVLSPVVLLLIRRESWTRCSN